MQSNQLSFYLETSLSCNSNPFPFHFNYSPEINVCKCVNVSSRQPEIRAAAAQPRVSLDPRERRAKITYDDFGLPWPAIICKSA